MHSVVGKIISKGQVALKSWFCTLKASFDTVWPLLHCVSSPVKGSGGVLPAPSTPNRNTRGRTHARTEEGKAAKRKNSSELKKMAITQDVRLPS